MFYGIGPDTPEAVTRIQCPVYGFYGGNDARVNATIFRTNSLMQAAAKSFAYEIYEGAGHAFMCRGEITDATDANYRARDAAWQR